MEPVQSIRRQGAVVTTLDETIEREKRRALDKTREIEDFAGRGAAEQSRRVYRFNVTTPQAYDIGKHEHLIVENVGAATLQYAAALEAGSAIDWIPAGGSDQLDGDKDRFLPLSCATITTALITVW